MHPAPFNRLVRRMDEIATETEESTFLQIGTASPAPINGSYARFLSDSEFDRLFDESRIVVSHAGVGTILKAALLEKPIICVPRLRRYGEAWDDHQLEICQQLSRTNGLSYFQRTERLGLGELDSASPPALHEASENLAGRILSFLQNTTSHGRVSG